MLVCTRLPHLFLLARAVSRSGATSAPGLGARIDRPESAVKIDGMLNLNPTPPAPGLVARRAQAGDCTLGASIKVDVRSDSFGGETSWELKNTCTGAVIASVGSLTSSTQYSNEYCTAPGAFQFVINDSYGDGIFNPGNYQVYYQGAQVASGGGSGGFDNSETTNFGACADDPTFESASGCNLEQGILASFVGECTYQNFVDSLPDGCSPTALFPDGDGNTTIAEACEYSATAFVEIQGTYQLDRRYFAGGGPMVDGEDWPIDTARVQRFEDNMSSNTVIGFPEYTARFNYNQQNGHGSNGYPTNLNLETSCELQTAMCCFAEGNFAADGVVETDVCHHDLHDSPQSNHIKNGWSIFPNDVGAESPTNSNAAHCVGFTWQDDTELLGNMMYDVSLRNSINHGYLQGIPGGPMCGCVEHMPVVEQAACRTASKVAGTETYSFYFAPAYDGDTGYVYATQLADIQYDDCAAGDLKAQYAANHADDAAAAALIDEHLVGADGCADDVSEYLNEAKFLVQHHDDSRFAKPDPAKWSDQVVGEGIYFLPANIDYSGADADFRALVNAGCTKADGSSRACIVRRTCSSCSSESHRDVYYQRLTALPTTYNFLDLFMNNWVSSENTVNQDFALYSSYDDAIAGTGAWTWCNYNDSGIGFPRDCGPTGGVGNNWNSYTRGGGSANHHAYWVEKP